MDVLLFRDVVVAVSSLLLWLMMEFGVNEERDWRVRERERETREKRKKMRKIGEKYIFLIPSQ